MSTHPSETDFIPDPARWRILSVLLITVFMSLVGVSIVNVALPSIQDGLEASQSDIQWVLSGYALTFGIVLVAAGRAGDLLGRGPLFIIGVSVFTLASIAAGLAADPLSLNVARFIQGIGSGLLNPQAVGMIQQYFRGAERGKAFGFFGTVVGLSVAVGPVLGGLLIALGRTENGWRWTFLVNAPVGVLAVVLAFKWFPKPRKLPTALPCAGAWPIQWHNWPQHAGTPVRTMWIRWARSCWDWRCWPSCCPSSRGSRQYGFGHCFRPVLC